MVIRMKRLVRTTAWQGAERERVGGAVPGLIRLWKSQNVHPESRRAATSKTVPHVNLAVTRLEGNELQIAFPVMSSQIPRHRRKKQPTLSFRKDGAPSSRHPTVNFESGILCPCSEVNQRARENSKRHPPGAGCATCRRGR